MKSIKSYSYPWLMKSLVNKKVRFTSDCEFFPNFDVKGKIMSCYLKSNELIFKLKVSNSKTIDVGSNMKNLKFEFI